MGFGHTERDLGCTDRTVALTVLNSCGTPVGVDLAGVKKVEESLRTCLTRRQPAPIRDLSPRSLGT